MAPSVSLAAAGSVVVTLAGLFVSYALTYRRALKNGENSLVMRILGRRGCLLMSKVMSKLAECNPDGMKRRLQKEGLEAIRLARLQHPNTKENDSICFVGSSTFTYWTNLQRDLAPLPCVNLAFGGSVTTDLLEHVEAYASFKPKIIVYYCGANDLSFGRGDRAAAKGFTDFAGLIRTLLPDVGIIYLSISLTPLQKYAGNSARVRSANAFVADYVSSQRRMAFVDITNDINFTDNWDWYLNDGLHLNNHGHVMLGQVLRPAIESMDADISKRVH